MNEPRAGAPFRFVVVFAALLVCEALTFFTGEFSPQTIKTSLLSIFLLSLSITFAHYAVHAPKRAETASTSDHNTNDTKENRGPHGT